MMNGLGNSDEGFDERKHYWQVSADPATRCESKMGDIGFEHPPLTPPKTAISAEGGAKSGAQDAPNPIQDPDLALLVERWPTLPEHIKAAIKALIEMSQNGKEPNNI